MPSHLTWGIKESFVSYLLGTGDAAYVDDGGATMIDLGLFRFPFVGVSGERGGPAPWTLRFGGRIELSAHGGVLFLEIAEPWLEVGPSGVGMSVLSEDAGGRTPLLAVAAPALATARPDDPRGVDLVGVPSRLTAEGRGLFNHQYPADVPMAPLDIRIDVDDLREL